MPKVDLGPFTDEDMKALLRELLDTISEFDALTVLDGWIRDNGLEGRFD